MSINSMKIWRIFFLWVIGGGMITAIFVPIAEKIKNKDVYFCFLLLLIPLGMSVWIYFHKENGEEIHKPEETDTSSNIDVQGDESS
jgi:hypothetical protein